MTMNTDRKKEKDKENQKTQFNVRDHFDAKLEEPSKPEAPAQTNQDVPNKQTAKEKTSNKKKTKDESTKRYWGWGVTLGLFAALILIIVLLWALFISGPARIEDATNKTVRERISEQVEDIQGLRQTKFDYVTWQGYNESTLYWFDATGTKITERDLSTLNYQQAREKALADYNLDATTVEVAYGYSAPVYRLENKERILMLDYDTLEWVYERKTGYGDNE
ncbi:MAG: hypothetical protein Q4A59_00445 [Erysipelotrichaceae bacterium]|nr:hypothetical protein [Erysipelotrichaceae bacterium]